MTGPGSVTTSFGDTPTVRSFARNELHTSAALRRFVNGITRVMVDGAYALSAAPGPDTNVVLHTIDAGAPKPYRRKSAPTFVIAIAEIPEAPADNAALLRVGYPLLVQALANLCVLVTDTPTGLGVRFVTLEQGTYGVGPGLDDAEVCARAFERIAPLASSRLVIANDLVADLPASAGTATRRPARCSRRVAPSTRSTCSPRRSRSRRSWRRASSATCSSSTASAASRTGTSACATAATTSKGSPIPTAPSTG